MKPLVLLLLALGCSRSADPDQRPGAATTQSRTAAANEAPKATKVAPPRPEQLTHVTIKALGMTCEESCPLRVRMALADITAVYELGFDLSNESIFVSYDATLGPPKQVTKPMLAAIKSAGFDPWLSKEAWPDGTTANVVPR